MSRAPFSWQVRVYWEDTDGGGVVYYANYLRFLERARSEWLRSLGWDQTQMAREQGILFVVAGLSIEYRRPARLDDLLVIDSAATPTGGSSLLFSQRISRAGQAQQALTEAEVRVVCVHADTLRPRRLPEPLRAQLETGGAKGNME